MNKELETYLKEVDKISTLTLDEEANLPRLVSEGDKKARQRYTEANLSLVIDIAKEYIFDMIQAGNLGLMKAVDGFDYTKDGNFSEYAAQLIRQAIVDAKADNSKIIRVKI